MTPEEISKLRDQELNELIAVKRGWVKKHTKKAGTWFELWEGIKLLRITPDEPPDHCNSWTWTGELLEEIKHKIGRITFDDKYWCVWIWFEGGEHRTYAEILTRAISEAYAIMECVE